MDFFAGARIMKCRFMDIEQDGQEKVFYDGTITNQINSILENENELLSIYKNTLSDLSNAYTQHDLKRCGT